MSPESIGQTVCDGFDEFIAGEPSNAKWDELRNRLFTWLCAVEQPLAFEGMLWVFEHSSRYQHQQLAGELLSRCAVPLAVPPDVFIRRIAPRLNPSTKAVATYLQEQ